MSAVREAYHSLLSGVPLSEAAAEAAFAELMAGQTPDALIGGFLTALKQRGEQPSDIIAGARVLRARATPVAPPAARAAPLVDTCGTGGDGLHTYNISTAAAFIAAGAGALIAKHGGRASSSRSGSADVLGALGAPLDAPPEAAVRAWRDAGVAFLFAPTHHAAMAHVGPARKALATPTIFNLIGPLTNPAGAPRQLLGVSKPALVDLMAQALKGLGAERAWVVHGRDGLDELSTTDTTLVASLQDGVIERFELTPEDAGLPRARLEDLRGAGPQENAAALRAVLAGEAGPYRDIAVLNAAGALVVAGRAGDIREGVAQAQAALDSGAAQRSLQAMITAMQGAATHSAAKGAGS